MSAGDGGERDGTDGLIEQAEAAMETHRLIMKIEETLASIERLGDHLFNDVARNAYGVEERHRSARKTAHALQDAVRALTGRARREAARLKKEHAASRGLPDLPMGPESNGVWLGPHDDPDA